MSGFISNNNKDNIPEQDYIVCLKKDLEQDLKYVFNRPLKSIFFGGGTPSLFSPQAFETILNAVQKNIPFDSNIEITMEANPGTLEHKAFKDYKQAGINRVSLGVQSFQNEKLVSLGRIHQAKDLKYAFDSLNAADLHNFNIDLMHGLPNQTLEDAIFDLEQAHSYSPSHISWYHLTLEPNTYFYKYPPPLPSDDTVDEIQTIGVDYLTRHGYHQYEVSAFGKIGHESQHNLNYWNFGDYLGIGAGAHSKISDVTTKTILRGAKTRSPKDYLARTDNFRADTRIVSPIELPFEFMLNTLRLMQEIPFELFEQRCFLPRETLAEPLEKAESLGLLQINANKISLTPLGKKYLNNVIQLFLP